MCYQSRHYARLLLLLLRLLPAPASTCLLSRLELLSALQTHAILAFDNIELDLQEHIRTTSRRYFNGQHHTVFADRWFWQHAPLITYMKIHAYLWTLQLLFLEVIYQSALLSNQVNDFYDILAWGHKSSTNKMHQDSNRKVTYKWLTLNFEPVSSRGFSISTICRKDWRPHSGQVIISVAEKDSAWTHRTHDEQ